MSNCILCEIVVPELQEEIARLKNKIKKLKEQNDNDVNRSGAAIRREEGDSQAGQF
jgi:hypothetical protein